MFMLMTRGSVTKKSIYHEQLRTFVRSTYWCTVRCASDSAGSLEHIDCRSSPSHPLCMYIDRSCCHKIFRSIRQRDTHMLNWEGKIALLTSKWSVSIKCETWKGSIWEANTLKQQFHEMLITKKIWLLSKVEHERCSLFSLKTNLQAS